MARRRSQVTLVVYYLGSLNSISRMNPKCCSRDLSNLRASAS